MFIGYLKNGFEDCLEDLINKNPLFDLELLKQTYSVYPQYCFDFQQFHAKCFDHETKN